ncbi:MAG: Zn-dependent hydrolase [Acidobacteriota bacterium]
MKKILAAVLAAASSLSVALFAAQSSPVKGSVVSDIEQRLGRWKIVELPFRSESLTARERKLVEKLVAASRELENIYWRQVDPEGLALFQSLASSTDRADKALRRYLWINGGRYDLLDENRVFAGGGTTPPGRGLYPPDLTRADVEAYVKAHPGEKAAIYDERTVVVRDGARLKAIPYHVEYRPWLERAAALLREAADLSSEKAFAKFLRLRATALLTDDYYESDLAWVDLVDPKFDIIFAPYETYLDGLLGVKTSYGAAVLVRNEGESRKLSLFQKYVPEIQDALPLAPEDRPSKRGRLAPMEVMDTPFRAGDLRHGYQAVADNLPNDPRVHEKKGSKRIFFKNYMDARVNEVIIPVSRVLLREDQAAKVTGEGYLVGTLMHEISHGLGPAFARQGGKKRDIREAIGPAFSGLEEAKADAGGLFGLDWLIRHGALPKERAEEYYASHVGGIFRTVRFGTGEAHARAEMMEFNFLSEKGAIARDAKSGRYVIDFARMPVAIAALAKELLEIEATGDRARAEAWFKKYEAMPAELADALKATASIPVDFDPRGSFEEGAK